MRRFAALVVSVGLVLGAVALRAYVIDGDDDPAGGGRGEGGTIRLVCSTELAAVCAQLVDDGAPVEVRVVDAGGLSDELALDTSAKDAGIDAWLSVGPWAPMTDDSRRFESRDALFAAPVTLATTPTAMVVLDRAEDQVQDCATDLVWRCVGSLDPPPRIGLAAPDTGEGLMVLAAATSSFFEGESYSTNDFSDPAFGTWFRRLTDLSSKQRRTQQTPLDRALTAPGTFAVVGALAVQVPTTGPNANKITVHEQTEVLAPVQLAVPVAPGVEPDDDAAAATTRQTLDTIGADRLREALANAGWTVVGSDEAAPATGLPGPGVLQALRAQWPDT